MTNIDSNILHVTKQTGGSGQVALCRRKAWRSLTIEYIYSNGEAVARTYLPCLECYDHMFHLVSLGQTFEEYTR